MITIDHMNFELVENYREAFDEETFKNKYSELLNKYDFIVGDVGYEKLRLAGFYKNNKRKVEPDKRVNATEEYLNEYCNFGCAYFILHNLDVQRPKKPVTRRRRRRRGSSSRRSKRKNVQYEIHEKKSRKRKSKPVFHRSKREKRKGEFTIRQKK